MHIINTHHIHIYDSVTNLQTPLLYLLFYPLFHPYVTLSSHGRGHSVSALLVRRVEERVE